MVKRVILHIGLPKTGSSSIQASLSGLSTPKLRVAQLGQNKFHNLPLATLVARDPTTMRQHLNRGHSPEAILARKSAWQSALEEELARPEDTLVLSSEVISNARPEALAALAETLEGSGRRLEVFGYVREPIGLYASALQQRLKMFDRAPGPFNPFRYRKRLAFWLDHLPPDQITLRDFRPDHMAGGSPVQDFAAFCGLPPDGFQEKRRNDSLNAEVTRALWVFNETTPVSQGRPRLAQARKALIHLLKREIEGEKFTTPIACIDPDGPLWDELDWLAEHTGIDYRPAVTPLRSQMTGAPLGEHMRRLAPATQTRLSELVAEAGIVLPEQADAGRKLAALYLNLLAPEPQPKASRFARLKRLTGR